MYFKGKDRSDKHVEIFDIHGDRLVNPQAPSQRALVGLRSILINKKEMGFHGLITTDVVFVHEQTIAFIVPGTDRKINGPDGQLQLWVPEMLFVYTGSTKRHHDLYVYFIKGSREELLLEKEILTPAWWMNVDKANGRVCLGTVFQKLSFEPSIVVMKDKVIKTFFTGKFTEFRGHQEFIGILGKLHGKTAVWKDRMIKKAMGKFFKKDKEWLSINQVLPSTGRYPTY